MPSASGGLIAASCPPASLFGDKQTKWSPPSIGWRARYTEAAIVIFAEEPLACKCELGHCACLMAGDVFLELVRSAERHYHCTVVCSDEKNRRPILLRANTLTTATTTTIELQPSLIKPLVFSWPFVCAVWFVVVCFQCMVQFLSSNTNLIHLESSRK